METETTNTEQTRLEAAAGLFRIRTASGVSILLNRDELQGILQTAHDEFDMVGTPW